MGGTQTWGDCRRRDRSQITEAAVQEATKEGQEQRLCAGARRQCRDPRLRSIIHLERKACALVRVLLLFPDLERPAVLGAGHPRTFTFPSAIK